MDHGHASSIPTLLFRPAAVKIAVNESQPAFPPTGPSRSTELRANAAAYTASLDELHDWRLEQVAVVRRSAGCS